jgi:diguanylate cyclase (GGDEF)-like protein
MNKLDMTKRVNTALGEGDAMAALTEENRTLWAAVEAMRAQLAELELLADTDTLGPILNRRAFLRELGAAVEVHGRHAVPAAVLFIDVNGLKSVNDTHGHEAGDAVILHVAEQLQSHVRISDTVARIGGDEFGVILTHLDEEAARAKAEALIAAINTTSICRADIKISVSLGYGLAMLQSSDCVRSVLARADTAMYAARKRQRSLR